MAHLRNSLGDRYQRRSTDRSHSECPFRITLVRPQATKLTYDSFLLDTGPGASVLLIEDSYFNTAPFGNLRSYSTTAGDTIDLTTTAEYKLIVSGGTGDFRFRLLDVDSAPLLPINLPVTGTMTSSESFKLWRVRGPLDQPLLVQNNATAGMLLLGSLTLIRPDHSVAGSATRTLVNDDIQTNANQSGDYFLILRGSIDGPFNYDLRLLVGPDAQP